MPKALFLAPWPLTLPPMRAEGDGLQLAYMDGAVERGGFCIMQAPRAGDPPTVVVMVHSTEAVLDAIAVRPDCAFIEDVEETNAEAPV